MAAPHQVQAILKRGKREVAISAKSDCLQHKLGQLNILLNHFLDPSKSLDDFSNLEWCRCLIAGGMSFDEFSKTVQSYDNATTCGLVWMADFVAYRCRTCGTSPCMSLCSDCFQAGNHMGHDFNMFRSQAGGACDCGNVSVMDSRGFCPRHGPNQANKQSAPPELLAVAEAMMPRLLFRLIQHMRSSCTPDMQQTFILSMGDAEPFLQFLHQLSDMGAAMRKVFSDVMTNPEIYRTLTECHPDSTDYHKRSHANYTSALGSLRCPKVPPEFRGRNYGLDSVLVHKTLLEELLFWTVKFEFPQKLVTLLLSILPVDSYKAIFTKSFMDHYSRISVALVNSVDRSRISSRVVHISVQLLSSVDLAVAMMREHNLLPIILGSLWNMMEGILTVSGMNDEHGRGQHVVVDCGKEVLRDHCYWLIISDLNSVLSHQEIGLAFMQDENLLNFWTNFITFFQGMNLNQRELSQHVEYEPETYYAAFSAELEICSSPLWALLAHCKDRGTLPLLMQMLKSVLFSLKKWFTSINMRPFSMSNPLQVSFHLPLHRYYAILLSHAVLNFDIPVRDILPPSDVLQMLMTHPLQLQVVFYEIFCGMWVRNGLQIRGQAMTYIQCHFCNSMVDADLYILQLCASQLDPDFYVKTLLQRFHVLDLCTFVPRGEPKRLGFLDPDHQMPLLEGALTLFSMILGIRTRLGLTQEEVIRLEMVTLLATNNRTHSQLMDSMPEKCGQSGQMRNLEPFLAEVAEYRAPNFEAGGNMQQGIYEPKDHIWETDYDPLNVMLRAMYRRDLQTSLDRYTKCVKKLGLYKGKASLWPPFRVPGPVHPAYNSLRGLLHCRAMHGLIFNLLFQAVKEKHLSDAVIYFTIFLLEMAVLIPSPRLTSIEIKVPTARLDKQLDQWYSSADIFQNINQVVPRVSISVVDHSPEEMSVVPQSRRSRDLVTSDLHLAPSAFSGTTSFIASATPSASPNQSQPSTSMMTLPEDTPTDITAAVNTMLEEATQELEASYSITDSSSCRLRNKCVSADMAAKRTKRVEVEVNESILTLLLRLHEKLSGKPRSYVPETIRGTSSDAEMASRIGDGAFFVGKLLDNICRRNAESARTVEKIYREAGASAEGHGHSSKGKKKIGEMDKEERRRKARERQEKLMKQFASIQKQFMEQAAENADDIEADLSDSGLASSASQMMEEKCYDCCICNQTTPSLDARPIGLVAVLQPTSVLGSRRHEGDPLHLPMTDKEQGRRGNCADVLQNHLKLMMKEFEESSCLVSVNIGWQGGVHVQTCGHYVHLDCLSSYIDSLKVQNQQQSMRLNDGEFWCPLCRNLSNTALPIIPDVGGAVVEAPPTKPLELVKWIFRVMALPARIPVTSPLTKAMGVVMEDLSKATFKEYKTCSSSCSAESVLIFVYSVLRTNLEMEILLRGGSARQEIVFPLACKKQCLLPLVHVLGLHSKILNQTTQPLCDLWAYITGVTPECTEESSSLRLYQHEVPLLLKDVCAILLQLVLNMPNTMDKATYQCFVQGLYNVQYINALVTLTCKFSEEERHAWHRGIQSDASVTLESLMGHVIELLGNSRLYDEDADSDSHLPAICQSVWSPQSVETSVQEHCLSFLRVSALLQYHLYGGDLPELPNFDPQAEFNALCNYVGLHTASSTRTLWHCDTLTILQAWCQHFAQSLNKKASSSRMLLMMNTSWSRPQLCRLPRVYDRIFQYYRKRQCRMCNQTPKDPALCMVCGQMLCFKERCCVQNNTCECVQHVRTCGSGTGIFLIVHSSIMLVIRGLRATVWGSVYLDEYGEEDHYLKRGKPLYLCEDRFNLLQEEWLTHSFERVCKKWIFHNDNL